MILVCIAYQDLSVPILKLLWYIIIFFPRYYCGLRANNSQEEICPVGHYCPMGSGMPTPCPVGTYTNTLGLEQEANCTDCDAGKYCNDTGMSRFC